MDASWVCPGLGRLGRVCAMGCPDAARGVAATSRGRDGGCPLAGWDSSPKGYPMEYLVTIECSPASAWQLSQGARRTPLAGVGLPKQIGHARLRAHMLGEPRFPRRYPRCPTCVGRDRRPFEGHRPAARPPSQRHRGRQGSRGWRWHGAAVDGGGPRWCRPHRRPRQPCSDSRRHGQRRP
jgi:hypothetical protein